MGWTEARAQIQALLDGLSITDPVVANIVRVYPKPPGTIQDAPSFVMFGASKRPERRSSGWRIMHYRLRVQLFIGDSDVDQAAAIAEGFGDALINAVDGHLQLGGEARLIHEEVGEIVSLEYPGGSSRFFVGFEAFFDVSIQSDVTYGS